MDLYDAGRHDDLRAFLKLAGDKETLGALDREIMGQTGGVEVADVGVRSRG